MPSTARAALSLTVSGTGGAAIDGRITVARHISTIRDQMGRYMRWFAARGNGC